MASSDTPVQCAEARAPPHADSNVIVLKQTGKMSAYIALAEAKLARRDAPFVVLSGTDTLISKAVSIAEIVKRKHPGVRQTNELRVAGDPASRGSKQCGNGPRRRIVSQLDIRLEARLDRGDKEL